MQGIHVKLREAPLADFEISKSLIESNEELPNMRECLY